jgi:dihydroorotate dehydrogenase electron transfer subunit
LRVLRQTVSTGRFISLTEEGFSVDCVIHMSVEDEAIKAQDRKGPFDAIVCSHKRLRGRFLRLGLELTNGGARAFSQAEPGQFAQIELSKTALPPVEEIPEDLADAAGRKILLRRPFSFCDVSSEKEKTRVDVLYCAVGPATLRMTTLSVGDSVSVIGPLGKGFRIPGGKKRALLVAGGMGAGPLIHLAKTLTTGYPEMEVIAFAGAKTKADMPFEKPLDEVSQQLGFSLHEFAKYGVESQVATDDGSAGYEGLITDCFSKWLRRHSISAKDTIIYSCGPEEMLAQMAEIARERKIECQISVERMMACGIGVCQSCAVECKVEGSNKTIYKLCCEDGPIFDSREVAFKL